MLRFVAYSLVKLLFLFLFFAGLVILRIRHYASLLCRVLVHQTMDRFLNSQFASTLEGTTMATKVFLCAAGRRCFLNELPCTSQVFARQQYVQGDAFGKRGVTGKEPSVHRRPHARILSPLASVLDP